MFHVGQKVICVDAGDCPFWGKLPLLKNAVYTVSRIDPSFSILTLELNEVHSPHPGNVYQARRFRPVVEHKTDTGFSVLEDIRKRESIPADERVRALVSQDEQA